MTNLPGFRKERLLSQRDQRWYDLDRQAFASAISVDVDPYLSFSDLTAFVLGRARAAGLALPEQERPDTADMRHLSVEHIIDVWLADPATDERFDDGINPIDVGLSNGDLVVLCILWESGTGYMLGPAAHPEMLLSHLQLASSVPSPDGGPRIWGVLLYTDEDTQLATYVRTHFDELNALSGPVLRIFVFERPTDWPAARRYWRRHLEPPLMRVFSAMRWLVWVPYDKHSCYDIARTLGVSSADLPCLVLFRTIEKPPVLVFPIVDASPSSLRSLFCGYS
jgi:hypothetical protein